MLRSEPNSLAQFAKLPVVVAATSSVAGLGHIA